MPTLSGIPGQGLIMKETKTENTAKVKSDFDIAKSDWGALNPLLFGKIRLCDKEGKALDDSQTVTGIAIDGDLTIESQYSSPFENSSAESKLPTLMGMLQAGDWVDTSEKVLGAMGIQMGGDLKEKLNQFEGKTNFTKVNSTQIFLSTQPVRLSMALFFEAWRNAKLEVENQIALLQQWALPVHLSDNSLLGNAAESQSIDALFPSTVPPYVSFAYAGKRYAPLLLESVSAPLVKPIDKSGNRLICEVNITLVSRTSWDKSDILKAYQ